MVLKDDKISENKQLRRLENQKVGDLRTCQPSYLPTFSPSCSSLSYFLIFLNIRVYPWFSLSYFPYPLSCFPYPLSCFLFSVSYFLFPVSYFLFPISYFLFPISSIVHLSSIPKAMSATRSDAPEPPSLSRMARSSRLNCLRPKGLLSILNTVSAIL